MNDLCSCDAGDCIVHPSPVFHTEGGSFLTEALYPMGQDAAGGMFNTDWELFGECSPLFFRNLICLVESLLGYEYPTTLNLDGLTPSFQPSATPTASELHPYMVDPQLGEGSFGTLASGNVALDQLGQPIIDMDNPGNPSFYSADALSPTSPTPDAGMHVSLMNQDVGSSAGRQASNSRRTRAAGHLCDICGRDFTAAHNLQYHRNSHLGLRPYPCDHGNRGCGYTATAPGTAKRHSRKCKYRL